MKERTPEFVREKQIESKSKNKLFKFTIEKDRQLKAICRLKLPIKDCAAFIGVSVDTIEKHIRRNYDCTFTVFREQNMVHTRHDLINTAITQAQSGNTAALIFCLKNLCGWSDKQEITSHEMKIQINVSKEDMDL